MSCICDQVVQEVWYYDGCKVVIVVLVLLEVLVVECIDRYRFCSSGGVDSGNASNGEVLC